MTIPGGKTNMLGQWRIVLRQAEESARAGRLDEALALAARPDVADHRLAVQMRARFARELVARAARRAESDDIAGAIADLALAERAGVAPDTLAAARLRLADHVADEIRLDLEAGEPARVIERVDALARDHVGGPALRRLREVAEAWRKAVEELGRGEFGHARDAIERAGRLAGETARAAIEAARDDLESRQKEAHPRIERLYAALADGRWGEVLASADSVLELVPEHPAARQARARAWQQIGGLSASAALPRRPGPGPLQRAGLGQAAANPAAPGSSPRGIPPGRPGNLPMSPGPSPNPIPNATRPEDPGPSGRFLLWADTIGGYLVCLDDEVVLGRAGPDGHADIPLLGDLSRHHATLLRSGDGYLIRARQPTFVNGRRVESAPLRDGDVIRLGSNVELEFRQPSPISATASLAILSRHRLPLAVDGVILMAETCILGPSRQAHIPAPGLADPLVLYRQGGGLWCRAPGEFEVDGCPRAARAKLTLRSSVLGEGFSFSLEPLGSRSSQV